MSGDDSRFDDVPEGGYDWAGTWTAVDVVPQCGPDHPAGDCICLRLVRLNSDGTFETDSSLSWDTFTPIYRWDQHGGYSSEGMLEPYSETGSPDSSPYYHPLYERDERYDDASAVGDSKPVYVVPVNVYSTGLDGVPGDMSAYSCETCRKLSPTYNGWQTEGPMYGVDDDWDPDVVDDGAVDVERGETDCRGLSWYLAWLEEYETFHVAGGSEWAISSLFQKEEFDYLNINNIKNDATDWAGYTAHGINNSVQWRYAWFMPYYAKFFESIEMESYKIRFYLFNGWTNGDTKANGRKTVLDYTFLNRPAPTANTWNATQITGEGDDPGYWLNFSTMAHPSTPDTSISLVDETYTGEETSLMYAPQAYDQTQFMAAENYEASWDNPRTYLISSMKHIVDSPIWEANNGKHMFISKTTFYDDLRKEDDEATHHRMLWPLCWYDSKYGQHNETDDDYACWVGLGPNSESRYPASSGGNERKRQLGASNPKMRATRTADGKTNIYVEYNPNEREGLIERFGPYHYLDDEHKDWNVSFPGYNETWEWGFEADRRTISQIKTWYNYYTDVVHQRWLYDENREEGRNRRDSDLGFLKVKATKYDMSKIYTIEDEIQPEIEVSEFEITSPAAPGMITAGPTSGFTGGGGGSY